MMLSKSSGCSIFTSDGVASSDLASSYGGRLSFAKLEVPNSSKVSYKADEEKMRLSLLVQFEGVRSLRGRRTHNNPFKCADTMFTDCTV